MARSPLDALAPLSREVAQRALVVRAWAVAFTTLTALTGFAAGCAWSFSPDAPSRVPWLAALPLGAALASCALGLRRLPRDPLSLASLDPPSELVSSALSRRAKGGPERESHALLSRWVDLALREASTLHRASLPLAALRHTLPVALVALLPMVTVFAQPMRVARGVRALYLPGGEWDGALLGTVGEFERLALGQPGLPLTPVELTPGRPLSLPRGGLLSLRGRALARDRAVVALRREGARTVVASVRPSRDGAFELFVPVTEAGDYALEAWRAPFERVRQRPALTLRPTDDGPPAARWQDDGATLTLAAGAVTVPFETQDDRGVVRVSLVLSSARGERRRPLGQPAPGATRYRGEVTLDPEPSLSGVNVAVEALDAAGHVARTPPRRVVVLDALDRRLARADALRALRDHTLDARSARRESPVPDDLTLALGRFRALSALTGRLLERFATEVDARAADPASGTGATSVLAGLRARLDDRLEDERSVSDPAPGPRDARAAEDALTLEALASTAERLDALRSSELARALREVAATLRRGGRPEQASARLEALERAARGHPEEALSRAARGALARGQSLARVAELLSPEGALTGREAETAARALSEARRLLTAERAVVDAIRRARRRGLPPSAVRAGAVAFSARLAERARGEGTREGARLASMLDDARAALALGDPGTAAALLQAARRAASARADPAMDSSLTTLQAEVSRLDPVAGEARALAAERPAQREILRDLGRLRGTMAGARRAGSAASVVSLAEAAARSADEGLARGDARASLEGASRAVAALEALLDPRDGEGEGGAPSDASGQGAGTSRHDRVELPSPEAFRAPEERRRAVLDALRAGTPEGQSEPASRYARWLLR